MHYTQPDMYIAEWVFHNNHTENRDEEIADMTINVHAISTSVNIPVCTATEDIQTAAVENADLQKPESYIIQG